MLKYLQYPTLSNELEMSIWRKIKNTIFLYLKYLVAALTLFFILNLIDQYIIQYFFNHSILKQLKDHAEWIHEKFGSYTFLVVVLVAPLTEEILFRLPLRLEKTGIGLSVALLCYRLLVENFFEFNVNNPYTYGKIGLSLIVFLLILKFFPDTWLKILKERYIYVFYGVAIAFGLVHLTNLAPFNKDILLLYPIYTLPQFLMGLFIGYVRIQYGFFYGVLMHSLINLPPALVH